MFSLGCLWQTHLLRFQVSFDSEELVISLCAESHVYVKEVKVMKTSMTRADLFLRIFEAIPGTLQ